MNQIKYAFGSYLLILSSFAHLQLCSYLEHSAIRAELRRRQIVLKISSTKQKVNHFVLTGGDDCRYTRC